MARYRLSSQDTVKDDRGNVIDLNGTHDYVSQQIRDSDDRGQHPPHEGESEYGD